MAEGRMGGTGKFRVVLIEDDASLRRLTKIVLERSGRFEVVGQADDGQTGIEVTAREQPAVILLDLVMPKMGGIDALPHLVRAAPKAKIVALSMLQSERFGPEAVAAGAVAFIDKSVGSADLVRRLLQILTPEEVSADGRVPPGSAGRVALLPLVRRWLDILQPRPRLDA